MTTEWHIWDFPDNVRVYLSDDFRSRLFLLLKKKESRSKLAKKFDMNTSTIKSYFQNGVDSKGLKTYIPISIVKKIPEILSDFRIMKELERNIIAYRSRAGSPVISPILPIKETPEMYSVIAHIICDGSAGKRKSPYYANTMPELIEEMKNNLQVFGTVRTNQYTNKNGVMNIMFPKAITDFLSYIFEIEFVRTKNLPQKIFSAPDECKYVFIRAMFDDEGSFSSYGRQLVFVQKERGIIDDLQVLLRSIGIETGHVHQRGCNYITVLSKSRTRFHDLIGFTHELKKQKSQTLFIKDEKIQNYETLEKRVYKLLSREGPLDRFQITERLNANLNSVSDALYKKLRNKKVMSKFNGKNKNYLWYVNQN
jgi:hypothetical protein